MTNPECPKCGGIDKPMHELTIDDVIEATAEPVKSTGGYISVDSTEALVFNTEAIRGMTLPAPAPREWFIPRENLDRADRNCDLGDSVAARIYKYPHKDDGHVGLIEKSAFDAVVRERDEVKAMKDRAAEIAIAIGFEHNQKAKEIERLEKDLRELKAEFEHWFDADYTQALKRRNELKAEVEKLQAENASLKDQLQWSIKNEAQYKEAIQVREIQRGTNDMLLVEAQDRVQKLEGALKQISGGCGYATGVRIAREALK